MLHAPAESNTIREQGVETWRVVSCRDLPPTCSWEIDTKYYKVCVTLGSVSAEETPRDRKIPGGGLCEALVLVVDASSRESWVRARKWAATRSAEALDGLDVKLCVLNKFDLAARKGGCDWIGEAEDWCLDNFFELIKVPQAQTPGEIRTSDPVHRLSLLPAPTGHVTDGAETPHGHARAGVLQERGDGRGPRHRGQCR